ncbi:MAG: hypothetical protein KJO81_07640 [Gammaproteobacteria bacterium]|nr:hypothetical protein [Gammaproteobacteria bacterium]
MTDSITSTIGKVMEESNIPFAIHISERGEKFEIGDKSALKYPDFPKTLFYDETSTKDMYEYLESNIQPRIIEQGEVKTIIGTSGPSIFAFFLNSSDNILKHHKFAKQVYKETLERIQNEI